jgi:protein SCO1/2
MQTGELLRKLWIRAGSIILIIAALIGVSFWYRNETTALPKIKRAPDIRLQNLQGAPVSLQDSNGKVRLVEFFYANCPDICPATTSNMVLVQNELKKKNVFGGKTEFVSVTFDPERDTPDALRQYAKLFGIDPSGWVLLRGTKEETLKAANDFGIIVVKQPDGSFTHAINSLFLVDQDGYVRKVFDMGQDMDTAAVEKDINRLLK